MEAIFSLKKIKILTFILILIVLFSLSPQKPRSIPLVRPFGGTTVFVIPVCNYGYNSLVFLKPAGISPLTVSYIYTASYPFAWGPPYRPAQNILGKVSVPMACIVGTCPLCSPVGAGPVILYSGTSI